MAAFPSAVRRTGRGESPVSPPLAAHEHLSEVSVRESPPLPPDPSGGRAGAPRDDESLGVVLEMVRAAIDLQFKIAERVDSKIRTCFGFSATVYAVAQAIVLRSDVHEKLGDRAGTIQGLAIAATVALLITMAATLHALRPIDEQDVSEENLRELLTRGYRGDRKTGADGVNLMIGQLERRKSKNKVRTDRLSIVIGLVGVTVLIAFVEVALAVEAVT
jgi:hypothetical protein